MTPPSVDFEPEARRELHEAVRWYADESPELGARFERAVIGAVDQIAAAPGRWPHIAQHARRRLVQDFPYSIVYAETLTGIRVIAVMHGRRKPGYWKDRLG